MQITYQLTTAAHQLQIRVSLTQIAAAALAVLGWWH